VNQKVLLFPVLYGVLTGNSGCLAQKPLARRPFLISLNLVRIYGFHLQRGLLLAGSNILARLLSFHEQKRRNCPQKMKQPSRNGIGRTKSRWV
jgi:hypothetical protein